MELPEALIPEKALTYFDTLDSCRRQFVESFYEKQFRGRRRRGIDIQTSASEAADVTVSMLRGLYSGFIAEVECLEPAQAETKVAEPETPASRPARRRKGQPTDGQESLL